MILVGDSVGMVVQGHETTVCQCKRYDLSFKW